MKRLIDGSVCPDCGAEVGQSHRDECDIERCSSCKQQKITCDCSDHDPRMSVWTGEFPDHFAGEMAEESEGLGPMVLSFGSIGYEPDINGPGAVLVEFKPTRAELTTLAYYHLDRFFGIQELYAMGQSGSWEIRAAPFSWRRFEAIAEALSPGTTKEFENYIEQRWKQIDEIQREFEAEWGNVDGQT
ncbi:hypothetical protein SH661x_002637 [Planctomicrobium sp. SH661]|uniref:hypothetical protein n=1 Tax=Planctomicrobium sp. SH661 TaxID=3448124 RepID=UPI003F5C305A